MGNGTFLRIRIFLSSYLSFPRVPFHQIITLVFLLLVGHDARDAEEEAGFGRLNRARMRPVMRMVRGKMPKHSGMRREMLMQSLLLLLLLLVSVECVEELG